MDKQYDTRVLPVTEASLAEAGDWIRRGELVGMPTETVYGLAADALNPEAVSRIFKAKGRPQDNPLIVHISAMEELYPLVKEVPPAALQLAEAFWPGPMTLIFPKADCIPMEVSAGLDTVGIRMPGSLAARQMIAASGRPIAAPSANRSGKPSPTTAEHVLRDMAGRIPLILDGGPCQVGVESSVIDARGPVPVILRPGGITPEMVRSVCGDVRLDEHVMKAAEAGEKVRSPGMKYRHYAPVAKVTILRCAEEEKLASALCRAYDEAEKKGEVPAILGFDGAAYGGRRVLSLGSFNHPEDAAQRLFAALRRLDDTDVTHAFCAATEEGGIGLAVMNRMGRAAAFDIVDL